MDSEKVNGGAVLSREETAEYLKICKATLDKLSIPKIKVSRRVLYRKAAIERWLEQQERASRGQRV